MFGSSPFNLMPDMNGNNIIVNLWNVVSIEHFQGDNRDGSKLTFAHGGFVLVSVPLSALADDIRPHRWDANKQKFNISGWESLK